MAAPDSISSPQIGTPSPTARRAIVLVILILLAGGWGVFRMTRGESGPTDMNAPLSGVLLRDGRVIAADSSGLYEASRDARRWRRLPLPGFAPRDGRLAGRSGGGFIYYWGPSQCAGLRNGLWRSADGCRTWRRVLGGSIRKVYLSPGGTVYVLQGDLVFRTTIAMSTDGGDTWRDITHGAQSAFDIVADPDNPEQLAYLSFGIRDYRTTSRDMSYGWETTEPAWRRLPAKDLSAPAPERSYGTQSALWMHKATLGNYFEFPFAEQTELIAFDIVPASSRYTFGRSGARTVAVELRFLPPGESVRLPDADDPRQFWFVRVLSPNGRLRFFPDRNPTLGPPAPTRPESGPAATTIPSVKDRHSAGFRVFALDAAHPYRRRIDLSAFDSFDEPGVYRVQLGYSDMGGDTTDGEWLGEFDGQTITVEITR